MLKDIMVAVVQASVPMSKDEGEKQILRLVKDALSKPVDMIGLPEDCVPLIKIFGRDLNH